MMHRSRLLMLSIMVGAALLTVTTVQAQTVVASYTGGTESATFVPGQSFTLPTGLVYNNLTFNFYDATLSPFATGNLYLFSGFYGGTPAGLAATNAPRATAINNIWSFGPNVIFNGGQLTVYADTAFLNSGSSAGTYAGGFLWTAANTTASFNTALAQDANFRATATVVGVVPPPVVAVPEPATWAMMIAGFGVVGIGMRRRPKMLARPRKLA